MERSHILSAGVICIVAFGAATSWNRDDAGGDVQSGAHPEAPRVERTPASISAKSIALVERQPPASMLGQHDGAFFAHVEYKYRYLLADMESARIDDLKRRLLDRENEPDLARKATHDERISEMLSPREREYFQALKDSDLEQRRVAEYVGGVGNVAPLDESQERQILDAKLRHKQRSAATLRDIGLERQMLSVVEREYAHARVAEALKAHLDDFLLEVSPSLTQEQYTLLRNYETTEFHRELEQLQRQINSK